MTCPPFPVRLDRRFCLNGVHSGGNTTWTTPVDHGGTADTIRVVTQAGVVLTPSGVTANTVICAGDHSSAPATVGLIYTMDVELSRPFRRDQAGAYISDRLSVSDIIVAHKDTGDYSIAVTYDEAPARSPKTFAAASGVLDARGYSKVNAPGDAESMQVSITNATPRPCIITGVEFMADAAPGMVRV